MAHVEIPCNPVSPDVHGSKFCPASFVTEKLFTRKFCTLKFFHLDIFDKLGNGQLLQWLAMVYTTFQLLYQLLVFIFTIIVL